MAHLVSYSLIMYSSKQFWIDKFRYDNYSGYDEKYEKIQLCVFGIR